MSLEIIEYVKDKVFPKGQDYVFVTSAEFFDLTSTFTPRIEGKWQISFNRPTFDEVKDLLSKYSDAWKMDIKVYVKKDVLILIRENFPHMKTQKLSTWQQYLELLSDFSKSIDKKASSELYRRSQGNLDKLKENLKQLETMPVDIITVKEVRKEILNVPEVYYPRDLLLTALLFNNRLVPKKGSRYSKYLYKKPIAVADEAINKYGESIVFYSIRKTLRRLEKAKISSLHGEQNEFPDLVSLISVYELMKLYYLFEVSTPRQLYSIILYYTGGNKDVNFFRETFLSSDV